MCAQIICWWSWFFIGYWSCFFKLCNAFHRWSLRQIEIQSIFKSTVTTNMLHIYLCGSTFCDTICLLLGWFYCPFEIYKHIHSVEWIYERKTCRFSSITIIQWRFFYGLLCDRLLVLHKQRHCGSITHQCLLDNTEFSTFQLYSRITKVADQCWKVWWGKIIFEDYR